MQRSREPERQPKRKQGKHQPTQKTKQRQLLQLPLSQQQHRSGPIVASQPTAPEPAAAALEALVRRGLATLTSIYRSDSVVVHEVVFAAGYEEAARLAGFEQRRGRWTRCLRADPCAAPSLCELLRSGWVRGWQKRARTTATGDKATDHLALLDGAGSVQANCDVLKEAQREHGVRFLRGEWLVPLGAFGGELREAHEAARGSAALQPEALRLLARVEEAVRAPVERWPAHLRTAAFAPRLGYRADKYDSGAGRRALACFLLHNGCPADALVDWLAARVGCVRADAWTDTFLRTISAVAEERARDQVWNMRTRETERVELAYDGADAQQRLDAALDRLRELHQQQGGPADAGSGHRKPPHAPRPAAPAGCAKYYERVFPFRDVAALLHRTDAESPVQLREVSVDKYTLRGRPVLDFERKLRETLRATGGAGLHAGRAFVPGPQAPRPAGGPAGVEVVLEVDELPPQLVRAVGSAERAEALRWPLMRLFVQLAEDALAALGFTELLRFASGNRGVHTWVLDAHALALTAREREALLEGLGRPRKLSAWPEARRRMLLFVDEYLAGRPDSPRPACEPSAARTEPPRADSSHAEPLRADSQPQLPQQQLQRLRQASPEADAELAELLWPVFDRQVAVDPTHLHRLPLSVHEKTGRVALVLRGADEVPPEQAAMPLASDPQLARKLEPSVAALRDFLGAVKRSAEGGAAAEAGEAREKDGALAAVLPAPGAPWLRQKSKKRKLLSGSDQADAEVPLAPFRVDQAAAADWAAQLRSAAALPEPPSADRAIAGVLKYDTKDWRKRLLDEARQLEKLAAAAAQNDGLLVGEPYTKHVGGRSLTRYPALDESQSVQRLAGASRHAVSGGQYTELDFSAAHPSAAWGACVLHYGLEEAGRLCPSLRLVATNKKSARAVVARQAGCSVDAAKRSISAALNRESTGGGEFMRKLVAERRHMQVALEAHPFVGGDRLYDAKRHCAGREKEHVSLFSHLLQLLEAESLRLSARALLDSGFETGVLLYDGLMVRQTGEEGAPSDGECVKAAVAAAERAVFEGLGFRMTIERREERDREDRESGFA